MARRGIGKRRPPKIDSNEGFLDDQETDEEARRLFLETIDRLEIEGLPREALMDNDGDEKKTTTRGQAASKRGPPKARPIQVDLHGLSLAEAKSKVDQAIARALAQVVPRITLRVITGKGRHSVTVGGVLPRAIHHHVKLFYKDFIVSIDESPADLVVGDLPVRGHFDVVFRGR